MISRFTSLFVVFFIVFSAGTFAQNDSSKFRLDRHFIDEQLQAASKQIRLLQQATPVNKFPKTFANNKYEFSSSDWWCSGFFPGTLLLLSEATDDQSLAAFAIEKLKYLEKEQFNKGTHDLGFMLYCSFGNALRVTQDSARYLPILVNGAASLVSRYNPNTKTIRSWDHNKWQFPVIIDNMMNLEFLFEVAKLSGDSDLAKVGRSHANTTLKNHFRADHSSYHVIDYDPSSGRVLAKQTHQGADDSSAWARGQAWGLYGFVMMFRETNDSIYLQKAKHIANFILDHPNIPEDLIPYWDFDIDKFPDTQHPSNNKLRDASAAAVIAASLLELSQYVHGQESSHYLRKAERIIKTLSSKQYFAKYGENGGFLLKHSVGALPMNSEVDVPLSYADYYYVEALVRYRRALLGEAIIQN